MTRALLLFAVLGLSTAVNAQPAQTQPRQREEPPPPPPPPEPAPQEAPPPQYYEPGQQQQQQPQPPPRPPDDAPPQPEDVQQEDLRRLHLAFGASGVALSRPGGIALGLSGEVGAKLVFGELFNLRLFANYTYFEDGVSGDTDHFLLLSAEPTLSFGFYSVGIGLQLGAADITDWGVGAVVGGFVSPAKLRFGSRITAEVSLDLGAQLITSNPDGGAVYFARIRFNIFL
ncbi:MAG: hypothetical protein QM723_21990 [Myxococcaceae bacterium]